MVEKKKPAEATRNFEEAIGHLETVVKEMEAGELGLEQMMAHYEDGMKTVKFCMDKLNEVEKKIEILSEKNGELETEPFEAAEE